MLRKLIISFSVMFAFQHVVADVVYLIAPGTEWGPDDSKLGIYSSAVVFALLLTFVWDKKKKTDTRNEGAPEQTSSGLQ